MFNRRNPMEGKESTEIKQDGEALERQRAKEEKKEKRIKIWAIVKWCLGLAVVLAGIIFVGVNHNLCYSEYETPRLKDPDKEVVYLQADSVCRQQFQGYDGTLKEVEIYMDNQGKENSTGAIVIKILDENGKEIGRTRKKTKAIRTRKFTVFAFDEQPQLEKDKTYTMVIKCRNVYNAQGFGVYMTKLDEGWLGKAEIGGKTLQEGTYIRTIFRFRYYDDSAMRNMLLILIAGVLILLIPYGIVEKKIKEKSGKNIYFSRWLSRILFVVAPFVAYFIMECLSEFSPGEILESIFSIRGVLNLALYAVLLLIFYALTNRTQYAAVLLWTITFVFGLANYFVFRFRGIPVLAADLMSLGTALNVADGYEYSFDIWVLWASGVFASFTGVMLGLLPYRGMKKIKRIGVIIMAVAAAVGVNWFYISTDHVSALGIVDSQWKPQLTYEKNGSMLSFVTSWKYIRTEKPEGYSVDEIKKLTDEYPSDDTDKTRTKDRQMPNVIAIMNESLADFSYDGELETTKDYLPFIHSMRENTIKGKLYVSIWGANTANSEFEFLTGDSLAFFAPRSVPYNNYVNGIVPSLTRTLSSQGYIGNEAYHPYKRSGWNREHVYNCFGFRHFYSDEYYTDSEYIRNFISDKSNMEQIIRDYEAARLTSDEPFYLFNVTVQNHGGYVGNRGFVDTDIKSKSKGMQGKEVNQYLTLAGKSDAAFQELVEYFENVEEPTVIVMFGDHQPPLSNEFYSNLFGTDVNKLSTEQTACMYATPYVIWANYDIEEKQNFDMSANYLSSYLLQLIGADLTGYNKYLLELQKKVPVITGMFYAGDDGVFRDLGEVSEYSDLIWEYSCIQYNGLLDQNHRADEFFFLKDGDYQVEEETAGGE